MESNILKILVIRSRMGNRVKYTGAVKLRDFADRFVPVGGVERLEIMRELGFSDKELKYRQRTTAKNRTYGIGGYITGNDDYFLPCTICIFCEGEFIPLEPEVDDFTPIAGHLFINQDYFSYIADGQHRLGGVQVVNGLEEYHLLLDIDSIDMTFVKTGGSVADRQLTADINQTPVKFSQSLARTMDSRIVLNQLTKQILEAVPNFAVLVNRESTAHTVKSGYFWNMAQFTNFVVRATGKSQVELEAIRIDSPEYNTLATMLTKFVVNLVSFFKPFREIIESTARPLAENKQFIEMKTSSILGTALGLDVLGIFAWQWSLSSVSIGEPDIQLIRRLNDVDFSLNNPAYVYRCLTINKKIARKSNDSIYKTAAYVFSGIGLDLPQELKKAEADYEMVMKQTEEFHSHEPSDTAEQLQEA